MTQKLRLELDDGRTFEAVANPKTIGCLADRVAFEHHFGTASAVLQKWDQILVENEDGDRVLAQDADVSGVREEWIAFILWRELRRRTDGVPEWAETIEQAIAFEAVETDETDEPDPTGGA